MLTSPIRRILPSSSSAMETSASRQRRGLAKGSSPSSTRYRANAAQRSLHCMRRLRSGAHRRGPDTRGTGGRSALGAARVVQVTEKVAVGVQHQQIAGQAYRVPIGLDAAIESKELPVPIEGPGINLLRNSVALTPNLLRLAVGIGDKYGALAVGIRAHPFSLLGAFGTQLRRHGRALLAHAPVHRLRHVLGELDPFHAHVDQFDARSEEHTSELQ